MTKVRLSLWLAAALTALTLTACGGGSTGNGYGSIAVSKSTNTVAIITEGLTQSIANESARDKCDEKDCEVVLQFERCGAASASTASNGAFVIATAPGVSAFDAQTAANQACSAQGGLACAPIPNLPAECN